MQHHGDVEGNTEKYIRLVGSRGAHSRAQPIASNPIYPAREVAGAHFQHLGPCDLSLADSLSPPFVVGVRG